MEKVARIGFWEWDIKSDSLYWSDMIYEIHGVDQKDYMPVVSTAIEMYAPEHRPIITKCLENAMATGEGWDVELQILQGKEKKTLLGSCRGRG